MGIIQLSPWTMGYTGSVSCMWMSTIRCLKMVIRGETIVLQGRLNVPPPSVWSAISVHQLAIREPLPPLIGTLTPSGPLYHPRQSICTEIPVKGERGNDESFNKEKYRFCYSRPSEWVCMGQRVCMGESWELRLEREATVEKLQQG